jgi:glutathione synthase/RimK-type ligase-like ATP-grasp enzyme
VLERFAEAKALALECLVAFPQMNFAGIDVAMSVDGPVIIESNVQPSHDGAAYVEMPTRDVFESA